MSLPSIDEIKLSAQRTFRRFPIPITAGILNFIICIIVTEAGSNDFYWLRWVFLTSLLALPLFTAITLYTERADITIWASQIAKPLGYLFLITYFSWLFIGNTPLFESSSTIESYRFVHFILACHLLVAFLPFYGRELNNAFWQFNRHLFLRFALATLYAVVLYAGLAAALGLSDYLLGPDLVNYRCYTYLWYFITFVFHPSFFLGGIPQDLQALESDHTYPRGLYNFTRFVLVPLVVVYLVILYLYIAKIALTAQIPRGSIGYLVSGVSILGTFTILLLHPYVKVQKGSLLTHYRQGYFFLLLPLMALLYFSLYLRISEYGITMNRYILVLLAIWLTVISVSFLIHRERSIKIIPVSLFFLAALTAFGPWSGYSVSLSSQRSRLEKILMRNHLLVDRKLKRTGEKVSSDDMREISALFQYILSTHGDSPLKTWFTDDIKIPEPKYNRRDLFGYSSYGDTRELVEALGIQYYDRWSSRKSSDFFSFYATPNSYQQTVLKITGYDYLIKFNCSTAKESEDLKVHYNRKDSTLSISREDGADPLLELHMQSFIQKLLDAYGQNATLNNIAQEKMNFPFENEQSSGILSLQNVYGKQGDEVLEIQSCGGYILLTVH